MAEVANTAAELSLSWGVGGHSNPRLIIPLVRLGRYDALDISDGDITEGDDEGSPAAEPTSEALASWIKIVADSSDLVVVLDCAGRVLAISAVACELMGDLGPDQVVGRHLLDALDLVDFNPTPGDASAYADRIPPLLAIASNGLSRGLLRVRTSGRTITVDAVAAPLHDELGGLVGAVAFLAQLGH